MEVRTRVFVLGDCIAPKELARPPETVLGPQIVACIALNKACMATRIYD